MNNLDYAQSMAALFSKNMVDYSWVTDSMNEQDINKYLMEYSSVDKIKESVVSEIDFSGVAKQLSEDVLLSKLAKIEQLKKQLEQERNSIRAHYSSLAMANDRIFKTYRDIEVLSDNLSVIPSISVSKSNFWRDYELLGSEFTCVSVPVFIRFIYSDTPYEIPMGQYKLYVNLINKKTSIVKYQNNLVTNYGNYHPYISHNGTICFGNKANQAETMIATCDLDGFLDLTAALLTQYSDDTTPYVKLIDFAEIYAKRYPGMAYYCDRCGNFKSLCECVLCPICKKFECSCSVCEHCGSRYDPEEQENEDSLHDKCYCAACCSETGSTCDCRECSNCGHLTMGDELQYFESSDEYLCGDCR